MPQSQSTTALPAASLTWLGASGGAAALSWPAALAVVAYTHATSPTPGVAALIVAAVLTVVATILRARIVAEQRTGDEHRQLLRNLTDLARRAEQHHRDSLSAHAQIASDIQQLRATLVEMLPKVIEDAKWQGYAAGVEDAIGGQVISFPRRA